MNAPPPALHANNIVPANALLAVYLAHIIMMAMGRYSIFFDLAWRASIDNPPAGWGTSDGAFLVYQAH